MKFPKLHFKKCFDPKIANFCFRQRSNERFTMFISSQYSSCLTHQPPLLQFHLSERFIKTLFKRKLGLVYYRKTSKTSGYICYLRLQLAKPPSTTQVSFQHLPS